GVSGEGRARRFLAGARGWPSTFALRALADDLRVAHPLLAHTNRPNLKESAFRPKLARTFKRAKVGEAGIRTLDTGFSPYNGLANRRLQPLGHLTAGH